MESEIEGFLQKIDRKGRKEKGGAGVFHRYEMACGIVIDIDKDYPWTKSLRDFMPGSEIVDKNADVLPDLEVVYEKNLCFSEGTEPRNGFRIGKGVVSDAVKGYAIENRGGTLAIRTAKPCYFMFFLCLQISLLKKGMTFIHAAGFSDRHRGYAVAGWSGAGKTACAYRLSEHFDWGVMGDDLVIIDAAGRLRPHLKYFYLCSYHRQSYPKPEVFKGLANGGDTKRKVRIIKRIVRRIKKMVVRMPGAYEALRGKNPYMRRVNPVVLFKKEKIGGNSLLKNVFWIDRTAKNVGGSGISEADLTSRLLGSMLNEFGDRELAMLNLLIGQGILSNEDIFEKWNWILRQGLRGSKQYVIEIPDDCPVGDLPEVLIELIEQAENTALSAV